MICNLEKNFQKIGAKVKIIAARNTRRSVQTAPIRLDVIERNGEELFEIAVRQDLIGVLDLSILELKSQERHLVLLARHSDREGKTVSKDHFLCGHDERHLFVASVDAVSTVAAAKDSLKPARVREQETGQNINKRNRRKTPVFKRQGEWFFLPVEISPDKLRILKNEALVRGRGSKPHTAQFAFRQGGETVRVCSQYPNGLSEPEYDELIKENPHTRYFSWRVMQRNATVYAKGRISHADHATIVLDSWHQVLMNTERHSEAVAFLD